MKKVIVISGPTGIGKTKLACKIARMFNLPLINADASQMRKGMDIGTANITDIEVKSIDHYLFKFLEPNSDFSIKDYQDLVRPIIDKYDCSIISGGSGLYIDAALLDYDLTSDARNKNKEYDLSNEELYSLLESKDPILASKTHANNRKRVLRYLEIAGKEDKKPVELYDILYITLDMERASLYERINSRFNKMIDCGWISEATKLKKDGYDLSKIKEIGYAQLGNYLDGTISLDEASEVIKQKTRNYAKRQLTWFRGSKNKYHNYYCINKGLEEDKAISLIEAFLSK